MMKQYLGLNTRIIALFVGGLALPTTLAAVGAYQYLRDYETTERMEKYLSTVAVGTMREIDSLLERAAAAARATARDGFVVAALQSSGDAPAREALSVHLDELIHSHRLLELIVVVDRDGRLFATNRELPLDATWTMQGDQAAVDANRSAPRTPEDWAIRALHGSHDLEGLVKVNRTTSSIAHAMGASQASGEIDAHALFVIYAAPVLSGREVVGAVGALLPWRRVQEIVDQVGRDFISAEYDTGYAYLVDNDDRTIIGHKDREFYGTDIVDHHALPDVFRAIQANQAVIGYEFPVGTEKIAGLARSRSRAGFGWTIGTGIDYPDIYGVVSAVGLAFALLVASLSLIASAAAIRMTRRFRMSVEQLVETAGLVARGEMPRAVEVRSHDEIGHLAEAFNDMAETLSRKLSQQHSQTPFRPIRPNPYILGNPIRGRKLFYGRQAEFRQARELLAQTSGGLVLVFCGERRSGKTSILYQIKNGELGEEFLPLFVDLQAFSASRSEEAFFEALLMELAEAVQDHETLGPIAWDRRAEIGSGALRSFLQQLVRVAAPRRILILFDEYETIDVLIEKGHLSSQIVPFMASFTETDPPVSFVFSGSASLEEDDAAYWQPLFAKSHSISIGSLRRDDAMRLITEPVEGLVEYDAGVPSSIFRLSGGQPYYTQAICQSLVDHLNRVRHNICEVRDLNAVVDEIVSNPPPQMIYVWNRFNEAEKLTLSLLADCLEDAWQWATPDGVIARRDKFSEGEPLSSFMAKRILDHWVAAEFLEHIEDRGYRFRMDLFRTRIRRFHSVWQVLRAEEPG